MIKSFLKMLSNRRLLQAEATSEQELLRLKQTTSLTPPDSTHPFAHAFYDFCKKNNIEVPPKLYIGKYLDDCLALPLKDSIFLGEAHIGGVEPEVISSAIGHELAHILNMDIFANKAVEHRADRMAVQMVGAREPVIEMVEEGKRQIDKLIEDIRHRSDLSEFQRGYQSSLLKRRIDSIYGSHAERISNIRAADPKDRSHVDQLIKTRNEKFRQQRIIES